VGKSCRLDRRLVAECCPEAGKLVVDFGLAESQGQRQANPLTARSLVARHSTKTQDTPSPCCTVLGSTLVVSRAENPTTPAILQHLHALSAPYSRFFRTVKVQFFLSAPPVVHFSREISREISRDSSGTVAMVSDLPISHRRILVFCHASLILVAC
jgi:hypothetical protein